MPITRVSKISQISIKIQDLNPFKKEFGRKFVLIYYSD